MTNEAKTVIREFLHDLINSVEEMETAADKTLGEIHQKQTWVVLIDVAKHSLITLKAHADQWYLSERVIEVILCSVANICDEIVDVTKHNDKFDSIQMPALDISIRIRTCYAGPIY
ncbi:MAG: hypothetical protein GY797_33590 [Deltaproteobacteria bacterium]|nr:hypothetical protein [Deltaproteobacteria bacterium]